jgi:hypothetical protein
MCRKSRKETNFSGNVDARLLVLDVTTAVAAVNVNLWVPKPLILSIYTEI